MLDIKVNLLMTLKCKIPTDNIYITIIVILPTQLYVCARDTKDEQRALNNAHIYRTQFTLQ